MCIRDKYGGGHEHECRVGLEGGDVDEPPVTQPGSTVATSLCEGESVPKHCALLEVFRSEFRFVEIPLRYVRQFVFDTVSLSEHPHLTPTDELGVEQFLRDRVEEVLREANAEHASLHAKETKEGPFGDIDFYKGRPPESLQQPLVRIRVDHSGGFQALNPSRFGQHFVGQVANANDILLFSKKRDTSRATFMRGNALDEGADALNVPVHQAAAHDNLKVPDLVSFYLKSKKDLQVHPPAEIGAAVEKFVNKGEARAIQEFCEDSLVTTQKRLMEMNQPVMREVDVAEICEQNAREYRDEQNKQSEDPAERVEKLLKEVAPNLGEPEPDDDEDMQEAQEAIPKRGRGTTKRPPTKSRSRPAAKAVPVVEGDDEDLMEAEDPEPKRGRGSGRRPPAKSQSRASVGKTQAARQSTLSFAGGRRSTRGRNSRTGLTLDDDEEEEVEEVIDDEDDWDVAEHRTRQSRSTPTQVTSRKRKAEPVLQSGRRASARTRSSAKASSARSLYEDDDDDEEVDGRGNEW
eukprot:Plantae.Rhodophyta-Rhodochaete_pulchella.ctg972.p1 GENE.Plantae.Rhodophyta-Rhodochaete_pulchella.ctg972~~Plantae.Rhodophyta-Rhodochaete_pulchella.ctg972.p1  ORF type:complete len:519 (-),score=81.12 Plantae.Rhodophyta-Rhodochaete_pulchella.ctg972:308-1864(-)